MGASSAHVLAEAELPQESAEIGTLDQRYRTDDEVHILRRAKTGNARIRDEQTAHHAADEHDLRAKLSQMLRHRQYFRRDDHDRRRASNSLMAIARSRARPARTASTSARTS